MEHKRQQLGLNIKRAYCRTRGADLLGPCNWSTDRYTTSIS